MPQHRPLSFKKQASSLPHTKPSYSASFLSHPAVPTKINFFKFVQRLPSTFLIGPPRNSVRDKVLAIDIHYLIIL